MFKQLNEAIAAWKKHNHRGFGHKIGQTLVMQAKSTRSVKTNSDTVCCGHYLRLGNSLISK